MKRLLAALSLALLVSLAVGVGLASAAPGTDSARGNVVQGTTEWRFSAKSNFNGTEPSGTIRATLANNDPNLVITADVTCLRVMNGLFEARGVVTNVQGGTFFANSFIIHGSDAGKFSPDDDTFLGQFSSLTDPGPCALPAPGIDVQEGEVIVQDS